MLHHPHPHRHRLAFALLLAVCVGTFAALPAAALAHGGGIGAAPAADGAPVSRIVRALAQNMRVEALRTTAPRAVNGQCVRTVDVPGQGDSCLLPGGMWGVLRADGTTGATHGPDVFADSTPIIHLDGDIATAGTQVARLTAAGDLVANPEDDAYVTCVDAAHLSTPHTTVVFARPAPADIGVGGHTPIDATATAATVEHIRSAIRQASEFIAWQAEQNRGDDADPVRLSVLCTPDVAHPGHQMIDVKVIDMPALGFYPDFSDIEAAVKAQPGVVGTDDAGRVAAYYPIDIDGVAGQGWEFPDNSHARDNVNNGSDTFAVHYLANASDDPHVYDDTNDIDPDTQLQTGGVEWHVILHEMMHNMGAVYGDPSDPASMPPDSNGHGHCTSDDDIMCYTEYGIATTAKPGCTFTQLDCGGDTYFNASDAPPTWLANNWNAGNTLNRYLDFGGRTFADIIGPTRPANVVATSPAPGEMDLAWDASHDASEDATHQISYLACIDTTGDCYTTRAHTARITSLPSGATSATVYAFDRYGNVSQTSLPAVVNVIGKPAYVPPPPPPPATGTNNTPVAPTSIRVMAMGPGYATLEWSSSGAPSVTKYRVEMNRDTTNTWSFASPLLGADIATIKLPAGVIAQARVYAETPVGAIRSEPILLSTPARGASCRWKPDDVTPPRPVSKLKVRTRTIRSIKATFRPRTDANGVCALRTFTRMRGKGPWKRGPVLSPRASSFTIAHLPRRMRVQLAIEAIDAHGNVRRTTLTTATK